MRGGGWLYSPSYFSNFFNIQVLFMRRLILLFGVMLSCAVVSAQLQYTFTPAGAVGQNGPSQSDVNTAYTGTPLAGQVTVNGGIQYWVVPQSGYYSIEAFGGQGYGAFGGRGAHIYGEMALTAGDTLKILVGQEAPIYLDPTYDQQFGGGGGSFVTYTDNTPIVIAGGGGGNHATAFSASCDGQSGTAGGAGTGGSITGAGGTSGSGGLQASSADGGGGLLGNGTGTAAGMAFVNGGAGGGLRGAGGFGGGGGTSSWNNFRCGGGGGYSGGGASNNGGTCCPTGGGGGSFNAGANPVNLAGVNLGDGKVVIVPLSSGAINDIGVTSIDAPSNFCAGTRSVLATIQNYGTNVVTSATVNWSVNGVTQTAFSFTGNLDTIGGSGSVSAQVTLGTFNFLASTPYTITVWTSQPNSVNDTVNANDTISSVRQSGLIAPTGFSVANVTATSAIASWNVLGGAGYVIEWGPLGFTPGTGNRKTGTGTSYGISGLTSNTAYDVYVADSCGANDIGAFAGPISILTPCVTFTAPFSEDFDSSSTGWVASGNNNGNGISPCWGSTPNTASTSVFKWIPRSTGPTSGNGPLNDQTGGNFMYCEASGSSASDIAYLTTPPVDVSTLTTPAIYFYQHRYSNGSIADMDIEVSNDFGSTWTNVYSVTGDIQTASSDPWVLEFVNLAAYTGDTIQVRFKQSGNGCCGDAAIDDVVIDEAPTCPWPTGLTVTSITDSNAIAAWNDPSGTKWDLFWGPSGFQQGSPGTFSMTTSTNPDTLGGLLPNTLYDYYVRANCTDSANGVSLLIGPFTFRTNCLPFTAPYTDNFDSSPNNAVPFCWANNITGGRTTVGVAQTYQFGTPNTSPNHIRFYNGNPAGPGDTTLFISPQFSDLTAGNKRIQFMANGTTTLANELVVGTMTNPLDVLSFTPIDTVQLTNTYQLYVVNVDLASGYNGTDKYVAFRHGNSSTFRTIYIDDFIYETIPSCNPPFLNTLGVAGVSPTSATIYWGAGTDGNETHWEVGPVGFTPGTNAWVSRDSVAGNIDTTVAGGLIAQTTYEFYVRDSCAANGFSPWIGPFSFNTACNIFTAPLVENFDGTTWVASGNNNGNSLDPCWTSTPDVTSNSVFKWIPRSTGPTSGNGPLSDKTGTNYLYCEASGSSNTDVAYLYSPIVDVSALTVPALYFSQHRYSNATIADMDVEVTNDFGVTWTNVYSVTGDIQTSNSAPWEDEIIPLGAFVGDTIQIRFIQNSNGCCGDAAIDDVQIKEAPSCPDVISLDATGISDSTATLQWVGNPSVNSFELWFGPQGFFQGTATVGGVKSFRTGQSLLVDTMTGNKCYEFLVRGICAPGDTGNWVGPFVFCTECSPFNAPYYTGVDNMSTGETPDCWTPYFVGGTGNFAAFEVYAFGTPNSAPNHIRFYNYNQDTTMGISPRFNDLNAGNKRIRFFAEVTTTLSPNTIIVGTVSDPSSGRSFSPIDTISITNSKMEYTSEITVANGYNGTDNYIALLHGNNSTFRTYYIDDFHYENIPTCIRPDSLAVGNVTTTTAALSWQNAASSTGTNFRLSYGLNLSNPANGTKMMATGNTATLTGLTPASTYCVYVQEVCAPGDSSFWRGPVCFNTLCAPIPLPYKEEFQGPGLPNCYTTFNSSSSTSANAFWKFAGTWPNYGAQGINNAPGSTGGSLGVDGSTPNDSMVTLETPQFSVGSAASPYMSFLKFQNNTQASNPNSQTLYVDVYDGATWHSKVITDDSSSTSWRLFTIDLSTYTITGPVRFRFHVDKFTGGPSSFYSDIMIDDLRVFDFASTTSCLPVTGVSSTAKGCDSITVDWTSNTNYSLVQYGPTGFTLGQGMFSGIVTSSPYTITGLMPNTAYDIYIADTCGSDTSAYFGPLPVTTDAGPLPVADVQLVIDSISGSTKYFALDASGSTGATSYSWNYGNGTGTSNGAGALAAFTTNGSQTVVVTATNSCGSDTDTIVLNVDISLFDNELSQSLSIFPNPASNQVNISFDSFGSADAVVRVLDLTGKEVMVKVLDNLNGKADFMINIGNLADGVYMIEVSNGELNATKRLIKQ